MGLKKDRVKGIVDVTLDQFANSAQASARFNKAVLNLTSLDVEEAEEEEDSESESCGKRLKTSPADEEVVEAPADRRDFPAVLWQVLSEFIPPDCVGKFACLCRGAYEVTSTRAFWRGLYARYGAPEGEEVPYEVSLRAVQRCDLLVRQRAIRGLHLSFPAFGGEPALSSCLPKVVGLRFHRFTVVRDCLLILLNSRRAPGCVQRPSESWEEAAGRRTSVYEETDELSALWMISLRRSGLIPSMGCLGGLLALDASCRVQEVTVTQKVVSRGAEGTGSSLDVRVRFCRSGSRGEAVLLHFPDMEAVRILPWWKPGFSRLLTADGPRSSSPCLP